MEWSGMLTSPEVVVIAHVEQVSISQADVSPVGGDSWWTVRVEFAPRVYTFGSWQQAREFAERVLPPFLPSEAESPRHSGEG